ncbi:MAG: hypothetical protein KJO42_17220 [Silicimonas sp.]|nr:hypothetical protein [Silicimonas sp.]MBT8425249.1 hypothetical protein [Silicimonas sp.]NND40828.1 hypothetical protein [Silicimonas sp.]NNL35891.1 hypothetical protein [Silicimonas sp.]RZW04810.1 MAG: hypothetical protein EX266_10280 [Paracoccaceae bacterium]
MTDKIEVENVNIPGQVTRVDADKYRAMKDAMLKVVSDAPMSAAEIKEAASSHLPDDLFPGGATSGWWAKCVQLDLEAKGVLVRHQTKPLRWSLA